jgi:hypothetical protein
MDKAPELALAETSRAGQQDQELLQTVKVVHLVLRICV